MRFRTLAVGMFLLVWAADASAQICLGRPSFSEGPYQASLGASFTDGAQGFGGGVALGSDDIFGGAGLDFTNVSDADAWATSFGVDVGASFMLNPREGIEACPVASVIIRSGPDVGEIDTKGVGLRAGGRLGILAAESGNLDVVPTFGLDIAYDRITAEIGPVETTARDTYVIVRVGVGLILNDRMGLVPSLGVPLGIDDADPEFSIVFALNFGQR
jgi:hypothetical protein